MINKVEMLANILREQIRRGDYGIRGKLPSASQLSREHGIGKTTAFQALQLLQAEGVVVLQDKSFYANTTLLLSTIPTPRFEDILLSQAIQPFTRNIINPEIIVMPEDIALMFHVEPVVCIHRLRVQGKADTPYRMSEYWYPKDLAEKYISNMWSDPTYDTLESIKADLNITRQLVHDDVLSRIPTKQEAELLKITRNTPVQEVRRTNRSPENTVLMHHRIIFTGPYSVLSYNYELKSKELQISTTGPKKTAVTTIPDNMAAFVDFYRRHGVPETSASRAGKEGHFEILTNGWKVNGLSVKRVLNQTNQEKFIRYFRDKKPTTSIHKCDIQDCPCQRLL